MKTAKPIIALGIILGASLTWAVNSSTAESRSRVVLKPYSADWYAVCSQRYRSFNPRTGYFINLRGRRVFCTATVSVAQPRYRGHVVRQTVEPYRKVNKSLKEWQQCVFDATPNSGYSAIEC